LFKNDGSKIRGVVGERQNKRKMSKELRS